MMTKYNVKIGDIVYSVEPWSERIQKACVSEICEYGVLFHCLAFVDKDGNDIANNRGVFAGATWDNLYLTAEEAHERQKSKNEAAFLAFCEKIQTVDDLVRFALEEDITGSEYSDCNARKAYISRAKDFGFDVELEMEAER